VSGVVPEGLYRCPNCSEVFAHTDVCPRCDDATGVGPPWIWGGHGWVQPRADGTVWTFDPITGQIEPAGGHTPPSSFLEACSEGHKYRRADEAQCPECAASVPAASEQAAIAARPTELSTSSNWKPFAFVAMIVLFVLAANWDGIASSGDLSNGSAGATATTEAPSETTSSVRRTTTTTGFDPGADWEVGACVSEGVSGISVWVVSCSQPHDGRIVATPSSETRCPADTTHTVDLERGVACLSLTSYLPIEGFDAGSCSFDGIPLFGNVHFAESGTYDVLVTVTDSSFLADITVVSVEYSWQADSCGLWYVVENRWEADFVVAGVESGSLADITIAIGEREWEAGP